MHFWPKLPPPKIILTWQTSHLVHYLKVLSLILQWHVYGSGVLQWPYSCGSGLIVSEIGHKHGYSQQNCRRRTQGREPKDPIAAQSRQEVGPKARP